MTLAESQPAAPTPAFMTTAPAEQGTPSVICFTALASLLPMYSLFGTLKCLLQVFYLKQKALILAGITLAQNLSVTKGVVLLFKNMESSRMTSVEDY